MGFEGEVGFWELAVEKRDEMAIGALLGNSGRECGYGYLLG